MRESTAPTPGASPPGPRRGWLRDFWPAGLWAVVMFGLSSIPGSGLPEMDVPNVDKLLHAGAFGVLSIAILYGLRRGRGLAGSRPRDVLLAIALTVAYGVADEIHQAFVPERSPDVMDLIADFVGALLATLATVALARLSTRRVP